MIILTDETRKLLADLEKGIDKKRMQANWDTLNTFAPIHSGSPQEMQAIEFLRDRLEEYGLEPRLHMFEAYISDPKFSRLRITYPVEMEVQCTPYRQVGSTTPEGFEAEVIYVPPEEMGYADCRGKVVLCEQKTSGDWMGLRAGFLLRLWEVTGDDDFMRSSQELLGLCETGAADRYTSPQSGFFGWAASMLYAATGNVNYERIATLVLTDLIKRQRPDGSWLDPSLPSDLPSARLDATAEGLLLTLEILDHLEAAE